MQARHKISLFPSGVQTSGPIVSTTPDEFPAIAEGRYEARLARNARETVSALRLRHMVFRVEMAGKSAAGSGVEFDAYDFKCRHLIVIDRDTGSTVGTYRLNTLETAGSIRGFYSANEFSIEALPEDILRNGVEIGRACVAKEHRNTKVLLLLFKALLSYLEQCRKRYFFGCCSIFTENVESGRRAFRRLELDGYLHERVRVTPFRNGVRTTGGEECSEPFELPALFDLYLRLGARVCGPPMIDREFGTIDFFALFDVRCLSNKYRRMFAR